MSTAPTPYVDLYLLPVRSDALGLYEQQATTFGRVAREHGALGYREFRGDDLGERLRPAEGMSLMAAVVEFTSRAHRDEVMTAVMADPRVEALLEQEQPAAMEEMRYGGFAAFVTA